MISLQHDRELTFIEPASLIVRVHDNQRKQRPSDTDYSDLDTKYIPISKSEKYLFNYNTTRNSSSKSIADMF